MNTKEKKEFNVQFWRFLWASTLIGLSACLGNVVDAMIVGNLQVVQLHYRSYGHHHMALFISFALSLTVIPVLWLFSLYAEEWIWYGFLTAYIIEMVAIYVLHKMTHVKFELIEDNKQQNK